MRFNITTPHFSQDQEVYRKLANEASWQLTLHEGHSQEHLGLTDNLADLLTCMYRSEQLC